MSKQPLAVVRHSDLPWLVRTRNSIYAEPVQAEFRFFISRAANKKTERAANKKTERAANKKTERFTRR